MWARGGGKGGRLTKDDDVAGLLDVQTPCGSQAGGEGGVMQGAVDGERRGRGRDRLVVRL